MAEKLTEREAALAKRVGKGGRAFVLARRERPGLSLLEFEKTSGDADEVAVESTAAEPVEAAPVPDSSTSSTTTTARKSAAKKAGGASAR